MQISEGVLFLNKGLLVNRKMKDPFDFLMSIIKTEKTLKLSSN